MVSVPVLVPVMAMPQVLSLEIIRQASLQGKSTASPPLEVPLKVTGCAVPPVVEVCVMVAMALHVSAASFLSATWTLRLL